MERIYLSNLEWLAEWFMQLFFDPMYFYQVETVAASGSINRSDQRHQLSYTDVSKDIRKVGEQLSKAFISSMERVYVFAQFSLKASFELKALIQQLRQHIVQQKSTLNSIQSALFRLQLNSGLE